MAQASGLQLTKANWLQYSLKSLLFTVTLSMHKFVLLLNTVLQSQLTYIQYTYNKKAQLTQREARDSLGI